MGSRQAASLGRGNQRRYSRADRTAPLEVVGQPCVELLRRANRKIDAPHEFRTAPFASGLVQPQVLDEPSLHRYHVDGTIHRFGSQTYLLKYTGIAWRIVN